MNSFNGHIADIQSHGNLSVVTVEITPDCLLKAIIIDTPETTDYLTGGHEVGVLFKETEVVIGLGDNLAVSLQNRIPGTILSLEKGVLLSRLVVQTAIGHIVSVISTDSVQHLALEINQKVVAMVKLNEVSLSVK
ncbi:TOBE domain-containing protein [Fulvivirga ulvae]|uniref:TOBE domain-containing protein n=1 Tax=Fulvivirga ulvae TaxID=2904245 RepID=UPI001F432FBD|nr:TOBE domain-containing protein [Fulvivirga ulvae]UII31478.1 TOBE domain-containing protein [Fulvivirga ulvae]